MSHIILLMMRKTVRYKEDVAVVKESFRGMLERGVYKEELFCDIK